MTSTALAAVLNDQARDAAKVAGPGLIDSTRLAMSSFDLWKDILETNEAEVSAALDAYISKLQELRADFAGEFAKASAFARSLREGR